MRVLYLHQYFNTPDMGGATRSYEMGRRLAKAGHDVHVVTADCSAAAREPRTECISGMTVHWEPVPYDSKMSHVRRIVAFFSFAIRAARRSSSLGGDVVFATSTPLTIALPAVYAARRLHKPMVLEVRDLWPAVPIALGILHDPFSKTAARLLERFAYRNADHVIALAPGMRDEIVEMGYPLARTSVIPNSSDLDVFSIPQSAGARVRASHPWLGERPLVLYAGTLGAVHNVGYLVELAQATLEIDPEVRFAVVGGGQQEAHVREYAKSLGVLNENFFMLGPVSKEAVASWLSACDIATALASGPEIVWKDATNNKFFDALAAGRPVASNLPGWSALVAEEAGAGITLPFDDTAASARMLVDSLRDEVWLKRAGEAALTLARERFNRDLHADQLESILTRSVSSNSAKVAGSESY